MAGGQILRQLLVAPAADAGLFVRRDVGGEPALHHFTAQVLALVKTKPQIARRMALAAVAERRRQIGAAIPLLILVEIRRETLLLEERQVPEFHAPTLVERERQLVLRVGLFHRRQTEQIILDRQHVIAAQFGVRGIRHRRIQVALWADALTHRAYELIVAPVADAGFLVSGDVGAVNGAERQLEGEAACIRRAARRGVARHAVGGTRQVLAARQFVGDAGRRPGDRRRRLSAGGPQQRIQRVSSRQHHHGDNQP